MSAAQTAPTKAAALFHDPRLNSVENRTILDMAHDLRQPLSTIEAIAYYLEMTIPVDLIEARGLLARVQQLLESTDRILEQAEQGARKTQLPV